MSRATSKLITNASPAAPSDHFTVALPKLTPGAYTVKYRVLSDDNHVMGGTTKFTISADAKGMTTKGMDMKKIPPSPDPTGK